MKRRSNYRLSLTIGLSGLVLLLLIIGVWTAAAREYIEIQAPLTKKYTIAVPQPQPLREVGGAAQLGTEIVSQADFCLKNSGLFTVLEQGSYDSQALKGLTPDPARLHYFTQLGCHLVIVSGFQTEGQQLRLELRLFDPGSGQMLLGKRYRGPTNTARRMATQFIEEVIFYLTGQRGGVPRGQIAFINENKNVKELYVINLDNLKSERLTRLRTISLSPAWAPDGQEIIFCSFRRGFPALYAVRVATKAVRRLQANGTLNITPAWGPGGLVAATLNKDGNQDIYLLNSRGVIKARLTKSPSIDLSPSFAPDSRQIAFVSNRGGNPQIYIMSTQGGQPRRLTFSGAYNVSPAWSPKGDQIAYASRQGGQFQIFTIPAQGGVAKQLTHEGSNENPSWSPNGQFIACSSNRGGQTAIYLINVARGTMTRLTHLPRQQTQPAWSPK
ncbi:MAG: PD40 domain-containing protein [Deltaproteobacteria bacterium]|nr:PD40 domain-containing protein [Deltaproteobacteria bacterium]MBW1952290.1 PD40 domain-containing protein [Deltaproteobacteria bacterium]MBW1986014.1 PD40 domain-containing protein [Deltaproteobacteria bacterium]MBW2134824.1 PD40 domain-containing protein [Deltaproteobacteria bacterium]